MKTTVCLLLAMLLCSGAKFSFAQEAGWTDDYAKAVERAKAENKPILLDFTGSDWCGWCMKMKQETLNTPQFTAYAQQNLVLMTVDFPHKRQLAPATKQQNDKLNAKYQADGFPTFVLIDKSGRELGRQSGYLPGGPAAFIAELSKFYTPAPSKAASSTESDFDKYFKKNTPPPPTAL